MSSQRVFVIVNPAAGQDQPVLATLNRVFQDTDVDWDIGITKGAGDAQRLTNEALASGADIIAAYGGDGTVMDVGCSLVGSATPLAILPGGTANVLSVELGIPADLEQACRLLIDRHRVRQIDVGDLGHRRFLLRVGLGLEAAMVEGAERSLKDRVGVLAYGVAAVQALREPTLSRYELTLDGESVETEGVSCIVANVGSLGQGNLSLSPTISVDDGLLDVIVLERADFAALIAVASSVIRGGTAEEPMLHWQARNISVRAEPTQLIQVDGEMIEPEPITVSVQPGALNIIVPDQD